MSKKSIIVRYTGRYPNLCSGEWAIYVNGVKKETPFTYGENANTFGDYRSWKGGFDDHGNAVYCYFHDGLTAHEWIKKYTEWLKTLHVGKGRWKEVYDKFHQKDWRKGQCGGCEDIVIQ